MILKVWILIRQDISGGEEVEVVLPVFLLHARNVFAQTVLARDLLHFWEDVDFLILVKTFIGVIFTVFGSPQDIPFVTIWYMSEAIRVKNLMNDHVVAVHDFIL